MAFDQKQFLSAIEQICDEKGISKESVIETVEAALAAAYKRDYAKRGQHIRVELDEMTGDMNVFLQREVVAIDEESQTITEMAPREADAEQPQEHEQRRTSSDENSEEGDEEEKAKEYNPDRYISMEEAKEHSKKPTLGDTIELQLEPPSDFGRVAAQTAKQVIIQRIREAERQAMFAEYSDKIGEVINGTVQRMEGRNAIIDLGRATGVLFPDEQIPREHYTPGQRLKVYLHRIDDNAKGSGVILSRACPEFVTELLKSEVPEIFAGTVEVKGVAREAGSRTKVAVFSDDESIDPVGACVGQRGTRIQTLIAELSGEKIDVIEWVDDESVFLGRALSPAQVLSVELSSNEEKQAKVTVEADQLSLAIGKQGQNVRLAAKLTGWNIDVRAPEGDDKPAKDDTATDDDVKEEAKEEASEDKDSNDAEQEPKEKKKDDDTAKEEAPSQTA